MQTLLPSALKLRHVVFTSAEGHGRAVNFSPPRLPVGLPAAAEEPELGYEEETFLRWVFSRAGLDVRHYRMETLRRRLPSCLRVLKTGSPYEARQLLLHNPQLLQTSITTLVIGVTSFFRDFSVFEDLRQHVLPWLVNGRSTAPRILSVGCSDGLELYSVAMLLADLRVLHACFLLGTDCRADAIDAAREGVYEPPCMQGVPAEMLGRHFVNEGTQWRVVRTIRTAVQWRGGNALRVIEPGLWDLILCRNMMMYLQPEAAAQLCRRFQQTLRPGGVLVLGKAERPIGTSRFLAQGPCIYRREGA